MVPLEVFVLNGAAIHLGQFPIPNVLSPVSCYCLFQIISAPLPIHINTTDKWFQLIQPLAFPSGQAIYFVLSETFTRSHSLFSWSYTTTKQFITYSMDFGLSQPSSPHPVTGLEVTLYKNSVPNQHVRHRLPLLYLKLIRAAHRISGT